MHITNVIQCTNLGGMERASLRFLQLLKARGHEVELISLHKLGRLGPLLADAGISAEGLGYRGVAGAFTALRLRNRLRRTERDVLLLTGHHLMSMLMLPSSVATRRVLAMHFHHEGEKPVWAWRLLYKIAMRRFDRITFASDYIRQEAEVICPALAARSVTLYNPLPRRERAGQMEKASAKRRLGLDPSAPVLGNAGWLIPRKRFDVFLKVAAMVRGRIPDIQVIVAGDGPLRSELEEQAAALGISDRLHWLGWRENIEEVYQSMDVLLFNSDWDAFPTTPLEAMSFGVPVVASLVRGGLAEAILKPEHGLLLPRHDVARLADGVERALSIENARWALGGQARVRDLCGEERAVTRLEEVLESAR